MSASIRGQARKNCSLLCALDHMHVLIITYRVYPDIGHVLITCSSLLSTCQQDPWIETHILQLQSVPFHVDIVC